MSEKMEKQPNFKIEALKKGDETALVLMHIQLF